MRIAMVSSECEPLAKTGGLADVVDALSRALGQLGHEVDVYLPRYRGLAVPDGAERRPLSVPLGGPVRGFAGATGEVTVISTPADGYRVRLVDHPASFDRAGYYGEGADYPDNGARFALLGRAALETIRREGRPVDVLHGHDWQSAPALLLKRWAYTHDPVVGRAATVLSCHNLAYHGWVPRAAADAAGLPARLGDGNGIDLLREAILDADLVITVSPTYARESLGTDYGAGLDDALRSRGDRYLGILNGIDPELWDPATDAVIAANYSAADRTGKQACRADLAARHGLDLDDGASDERGAPVLGMVGRLDPQKGFDLLTQAAGELLGAGARIVVLGTGDHRLVTDLAARAQRARERLAVIDRFDRDEARRIYAGSDLFLMPSRFEPCGQGQMISLRFGTVPLVRATGGLADTIPDVDAHPERGLGFAFAAASPAALLEAARRALAAYRDRPRWDALVARGMASDFSWRGPARQYVAAYERAIAIRGPGPGYR